MSQASYISRISFASKLKVGDVGHYSGPYWQDQWNTIGPLAVTGYLPSGYPIGVSLRDGVPYGIPEEHFTLDPFLTAVRKRRHPDG